MKGKDIFLVNKSSSLDLIEFELAEQIEMISAIFCTIYQELLEAIKHQHKQYYVKMLMTLINQVKFLHSYVYEKNQLNNDKKTIFILNSDITLENLRDELTEYIYQLSSMSYLSVNDILTEEINDHLVNALSVIGKCTKKMVQTIDELNLRYYQIR